MLTYAHTFGPSGVGGFLVAHNSLGHVTAHGDALLPRATHVKLPAASAYVQHTFSHAFSIREHT